LENPDRSFLDRVVYEPIDFFMECKYLCRTGIVRGAICVSDHLVYSFSSSFDW
jgi:hypothetical protein